MNAARIILVLGDQLTPDLTSLKAGDPSRDVVLLAEVAEEAGYVRHHKKKIAFIFSAMRHFAEELRGAGWRVDYHRYDPRSPLRSLGDVLGHAAALHHAEGALITEPGEHRLSQEIAGWPAALGLAVEVLADDRFICPEDVFRAWAGGRKQLRMEHFYREMRRRTGLLMDGDAPAGGKWNFDAENRKPADRDLFMPPPFGIDPDETTRDAINLVAREMPDHFGALSGFRFAVTRRDAVAAMDHFMEHALPQFGDYQDAMLTGEPLLYHAALSQYLNVGLLDPLDLCRRVEAAYRAGRAPLNAAEGFIRQVLGWREYVRGVYRLAGPGYVDRNFLEAKRPLPAFYWTAETDMACLREAIAQTRDEAYAHHIQRLMVTGNFAMLAGVDPREVHEWYLAVYADAFEWVEAPNTIGMSQFADGGLMASKPYAASGAYINRMSDYCAGCRYDVKRKTGAGACPLNTLYWDFLARNETALRGNPRLAQAYRTWDRFDPSRQSEYRASAARFLASLS